MAKQKTPVSTAPAKPERDPVAKYEAKLASPSKPKVRLPRLGCFWIFGIFLFFAVGLATGFYHSVGEEPASFEIPEGRVTVSDPECVLRGAAAYRELTLNGEFDEGKRFAAVLRIRNKGGRTSIGRREHASDAPTPAASPVVAHIGMMRIEACAS